MKIEYASHGYGWSFESLPVPSLWVDFDAQEKKKVLHESHLPEPKRFAIKPDKTNEVLRALLPLLFRFAIGVFVDGRFFLPWVFIHSSTASNSQGRLSHGGAAAVLLVPGPTLAHSNGKQIRYRRLMKRPCGAYADEIREPGNISAEEAASGDDAATPEFGAATANISLSTPRQQRAASSQPEQICRLLLLHHAAAASTATRRLTLSFPVSGPVLLFHALALGDHARNIPSRRLRLRTSRGGFPTRWRTQSYNYAPVTLQCFLDESLHACR
ncbi:hypothetical protein Fmac_002111 [Flemingia macrophylla]|uniref:Uncharacterized protein n=1 Tax=Flemingia macrophylla TaxID=520843 RepID=A0ABD1NJ55_9FABA